MVCAQRCTAALMKIEPKVEAGRIHQGLYASKAGEPYGAFKLHGPCGVELVIMVGAAEPRPGRHAVSRDGRRLRQL